LEGEKRKGKKKKTTFLIILFSLPYLERTRRYPAIREEKRKKGGEEKRKKGPPVGFWFC